MTVSTVTQTVIDAEKLILLFKLLTQFPFVGDVSTQRDSEMYA